MLKMAANKQLSKSIKHYSFQPYKHNLAELFYVYFNIAKYFGVFPVFLSRNGIFIKVEECANAKRKIISRIMSFCLIFSQVTRFIRHITLHKPQELNLFAYFEAAQRVTSVFYPSTCVYVIWKTSKYLKPIIEILQSSEYELGNYYTTIQSKRDFMKACFIMSVIFTWEVGSFIAKEFYTRKWSPELVFEWLCKLFHDQFFLDYIFPNAGVEIKSCAGIIGLFMMCCSILIHTFLDWLPFLCTLVIYFELNDFNSMLKKTEATQTGITKVLSRYRSILIITKRLNNLISVLVFGFSIARIPDFIFIFLSFTTASNPVIFFRQIIKLANWLSFMILATLVFNKNEELEEWLRQREVALKLSTKEFHTLLNQAVSKKVAIRGARFFKFSSDFLGTIVTTFLTFTIIILQYKSSTKEKIISCRIPFMNVTASNVTLSCSPY